MSYNALLINTCSTKRPTLDQYSRKTGEVVTAGVKCRWMWGLHRITDAKGEEIQAVAKVFFLAAAAIDTEYFLTYGAADYKVVKILKPQNSMLQHHVEVYVK